MKCKRCGMPFSELDAPMAHRNCDEDLETWKDIQNLATVTELDRWLEETMAKIHAKVAEDTKDWPAQVISLKTSRSRT